MPTASLKICQAIILWFLYSLERNAFKQSFMATQPTKKLQFILIACLIIEESRQTNVRDEYWVMII